MLYVLGKIGPATAAGHACPDGVDLDKDDEVAYEAMMTLSKIGPAPRRPCPN